MPASKTEVSLFPMKYRKNIRLKNYDYSQNGCYFVTICTNFKEELLSKIYGTPGVERNVLSDVGEAVSECIQFIHENYDGVCIDNYCIMPNHIHLLIALTNAQGGRGNPPLRDVVGRLKSFTTKRYREISNNPAAILWQRDYYEHVIRGEEDYAEKWRYIDENPMKCLLTKQKI